MIKRETEAADAGQDCSDKEDRSQTFKPFPG